MIVVLLCVAVAPFALGECTLEEREAMENYCNSYHSGNPSCLRSANRECNGWSSPGEWPWQPPQDGGNGGGSGYICIAYVYGICVPYWY